MNTTLSLCRAGSLALIAGLVGCGSSPKSAPTFDPGADARAQAATFISSNGKEQYLRGVKKVAVTGCNVLFAETSSASSETSGGLLGAPTGYSRVDTKVSVLYSMSGISDADMQAFTNDICADAERRLQSAGFDIVPTSVLMQNASFKALLESGRSSPFHFKAPGKGSSTKYKVFAPTGYTVYDPRYIGTAAGLAQAFKAAAGTSAEQNELRVVDELGAAGVNINILIDFAALQGTGKANLFVRSDTAEVKHGVNLGITGSIQFKPNEELDCWDRFGKRECMLKSTKSPIFVSKQPVTTSEAFYQSVVDSTTTGDKITSGVSKALSVLSAMGGIDGTSRDVTRYTVNVEPAQFTKVSRDGVNGFLDMAFLTARAP